MRSFSVLVNLLIIRILYRERLKYFFRIGSFKNFFLSILIISVLTFPELINSNLTAYSASQIIEGVIFAMFIGLDEETLSRGLIFASFESKGRTLAMLISSFHFGLMHLGNYLWGGQGLSFTLGQVIESAGFGYLACALMIFSRSIWPSIIFHGLTDTPMQFQSVVRFTHEVTSSPNWLGTIVTTFTYLLLGNVLLIASDLSRHSRLTKVFQILKLIE